jgi:hypothetical protein
MVVIRSIMLKTKQTSLVLVIVITTTAIMAVATITQILQPAYSQATFCTRPNIREGNRCITPGQNPSFTICVLSSCGPPHPITGQEAGQLIHLCHSLPAFSPCTVTPPSDR